jgi:hypothetical protein
MLWSFATIEPPARADHPFLNTSKAAEKTLPRDGTQLSIIQKQADGFTNSESFDRDMVQ